MFCQRGRFQPIALSPVCYLMARLIADCSALWFSSLVNDEQTVTGGWRGTACWMSCFSQAWQGVATLFVISLLYITEEEENGAIAGTDGCRRHTTDRVQLHETDTEQKLQHRLSSSFALSLNFSLYCLCSLQEDVL